MPAEYWAHPWPQVAELAAVAASDTWTLVGGLMVQLHAIRNDVGSIRPTTDIDALLHLETGAVSKAAFVGKLGTLRYRLQDQVQPGMQELHYVRDGSMVDVMVADHVAPRVMAERGGRNTFQVPGGTQALKRTELATITPPTGAPFTLSVPNLIGALMLKSAAYTGDSRDRGRHLGDSVVLLACITDPRALAGTFAGSDRSRISTLAKALKDKNSEHWLALDPAPRDRARRVLGILAAA
jgi:hypothetical protein